MTDPVMHLRSLERKAPDADMLRDMISFAAERLMEQEVGGLADAAYGEKALTAVIQEAYIQGISSARSRATGPICGSTPPM